MVDNLKKTRNVSNYLCFVRLRLHIAPIPRTGLSVSHCARIVRPFTNLIRFQQMYIKNLGSFQT